MKALSFHSLVLLAVTLPLGELPGQCNTSSTSAYVASYGAPCGMPILTAATNPVLGLVTPLVTSNLAPGLAVVVTAVSLTAPGIPTLDVLGYPLGGNCLNYVPGATPSAHILMFGFTGTTVLNLNIPSSSTWQNRVVHAQSFVLDLGASSPMFSEASNALCLYIGT
ncbi:MAG: hypothetical protein KDC98_11665 [Planctomycetes bacterium]|nr:hypothetical protein [Planctomycetota bacterium]